MLGRSYRVAIISRYKIPFVLMGSALRLVGALVRPLKARVVELAR